MDLLSLYEPQLPAFLTDAAAAPSVLRLRQVGMNCGCEYTAFPRFRCQTGYTRFVHSLGVGAIVWHFTREPAQALAGLLHDVATPTFAHVVDFLRGDYLTQEATEAGTADIIAADGALQRVLGQNGLTTADVADYHRYPLADNPSPRLSADRLEYTLGNMLRYGVRSAAEAAAYFRDLTVTVNEDDVPELAFVHGDMARSFAQGALVCSRIYVSAEDRYAMQWLSELLADAISAGVLTESDLYTEEPLVLKKLAAVPAFARRWADFCALGAMETSPVCPQGEGWRQIAAKKRYIDPLVAGQGRVSAMCGDFAAALRSFLEMPQKEWLRGQKSVENPPLT